MAAKVFVSSYASVVGTAVTGIKSLDYSDGGNQQIFFVDGDVYSQFAWIENIAPTVTVNTTDISVANSLTPGNEGVTTIQFGQRASGKGGIVTGSTALNITGANSQLGIFSVSGQQEGESAMGLPVIFLSSDGTTAPVTISLAAPA